ncbi:hypothetical protein K469DRAFT_721839 [Zopfia rhizophila CBS 207.26]|uniref:Uncharacterized protein n=1 Tax=Zopfia rhizophila CBS 207.26 TaxID=1314779 RepID=A0A6A6EJM9_9PEZI|nr:hypothetical protein K469DRAFT_711332 [Zopfia rhizophila CBS 207.26]KAF2190899.1 hypothetical protein K469DRAFT_721839 [Zopfia rhizophila CBS 207.26]
MAEARLFRALCAQFSELLGLYTFTLIALKGGCCGMAEARLFRALCAQFSKFPGL